MLLRVSARDLTAFLVLSALWGASFIFIRVAVPVLGPPLLMLGRVSLAALALGLVALALRRRLGIRRYWRQLLVLGAVNAAAPFTLIALAELRLTASMAAVLNATVPLFTALLSITALGERLTAARATGLLLGIVGVAVLVGWSPFALTPPVLLSVGAMLLASLCYALGSVYTRKRLSEAPTFTLAVGQQLGAAAWLVTPAVLIGPLAPPTAPAMWALLGLALLSTAVAYVLFFNLIARVGPTRTVSVTYVVPAFGILWGAVFLREHITAGMLIGLGLILLSLTLITGVRLGRR